MLWVFLRVRSLNVTVTTNTGLCNVMAAMPCTRCQAALCAPRRLLVVCPDLTKPSNHKRTTVKEIISLGSKMRWSSSWGDSLI